MWNPSYSPSYFSLSDILATEERVPIITKSELHNLGFLDQSNQVPHLAEGTKLELPYWMVLALRGRGRIEAQLPKSWSSSQRSIISADPTVVDLNKLGPNFYESGRHMMTLIGTTSESDELGNILVETLIRRFRNLMDSSHNSDECDALHLTECLDVIERQLFQLGQKSMKSVDQWATRRTAKIGTSAMVERHRKRKANMME